MKRLICSLTAMSLTIVILFCSCVSSKKEGVAPPEVTGELEISVLKVGQADAIIINTKNNCFIIDCGEADDGDEVVKYLAEKNINYVDCLFITHFDKDHVGGVSEVLSNISIEKIITPDYVGNNDEYESFVRKTYELGIVPERITSEQSFIADDVLFEIYPPFKSSYTEGDNDFSLAIGVTHGENKFLFTGDAEAERISEIIQKCNGEYDFLKVPHHGKYNKNTKKLFEKVKPKYAVVTDSEKNPAEDKVVSALKAVGCDAYFTRYGDVYVISDGKNIEIKQ